MDKIWDCKSVSDDIILHKKYEAESRKILEELFNKIKLLGLS